MEFFVLGMMAYRKLHASFGPLVNGKERAWVGCGRCLQSKSFIITYSHVTDMFCAFFWVVDILVQ